MNIPLYEQIFYAITTFVVVLWLLALWFMLRASRVQPAPGEIDGVSPETVPNNLLGGTAELQGTPDELSAKAATALAHYVLGPVKILERTSDRVVFEGMEPTARYRWISQGELRFKSVGQNRTRVDYAMQVPPPRVLLQVGWIFVVLGFLAISAGLALMILVVLPNPNPDVHWQSVQMVQCIHFIWPAFLFGGLSRGRRGQVRRLLEMFVHNLPYQGATAKAGDSPA